jgi:hypothetical protein
MYLYVLLYSHETFFECVETRGVEHLLLDASGIRTPRHEQELLLARLLRRPLTLVVVLKVIKAIAAVLRPTGHEIAQELVVGRISAALE